jgi:endonuclease/exonuclease/phosphatase family metal-dependent hydrolase
MTQTLSCISWNIHRGRCNNGRMDAGRMLDVLRRDVWQDGTDALILQEADAEAPPHHGVLDIGAVEAATGLRHTQGDPAARSTPHSHGMLGVVVYLRPDIVVEGLHLLELPGLHPRGAVVVDLSKEGTALRLVATHLSLLQVLRIAQMRRLGRHLDRCDARQTLLCGDLNEWRPWGGLALSRHVLGRSFSGPARASFPARWPLLPLDRVLTTAPGHVMQTQVLDSAGIRAASDHRPLMARVSIG